MNIESNKKTIPKIIHYVWVGGKPLTPLAKRCINSWKKYLPEYELKLWNEQSLPKEVLDHPYVQEMYQAKKWAFVSDYIRFWALEKYGGIYLDVDMEVLKSFNPLINKSVGFAGRSKLGNIESSIIALLPHTTVAKKALEFYDLDREYSIANTSPLVLAKIVENENNLFIIYDYNFFHPLDEGEKEVPGSLRDAFAFHHWAESWVPYAFGRKLLRRLGIMRLLKKFK